MSNRGASLRLFQGSCDQKRFKARMVAGFHTKAQRCTETIPLRTLLALADLPPLKTVDIRSAFSCVPLVESEYIKEPLVESEHIEELEIKRGQQRSGSLGTIIFQKHS